uniref:CalC n=1 Tax=uncultured Candidatus Entotheonella sp. TaxID=312019 RepID=A0A068PCE6_9BACT|nr:CalC [uncultured Candidatus Entotheonella sp.]
MSMNLPAPYPRSLHELSCLHELIEARLLAAPTAMALSFAGETLSAGELNRRANQCAHYLRGLGVGPDVVVAVLMERSLEAMSAFLGILKAGGAYLPLDPEHPGERLHLILEDAGVSIILTQAHLEDSVAMFDGTLLALDRDRYVLDGELETGPEQIALPEDLAYVIYTSGSTGKPKGCMVPHRAICNRLLWMREQYNVGEHDRILQKTPFTFDVSVWEIFLPMLTGACMVIARPGGHKDNAYLIKTIRAEAITICHFVPSMLRFFLNQQEAGACVSLSRIFTSGEALGNELMSRCLNTLQAELHNLYGPTEAAVDVTYWPCAPRPDHKVPIGRPIANVTIHILDAAGNEQPAGEAGELYIGGIGLARGYLNQPALTREKFIPDRFSDAPNAHLYKTGDKARLLPDGNIEFLGRLDFQVKLRGFRIELGEIESVLRNHEAIREAVVLVREPDSEDPRLVAYIETHGQPVTPQQARAYAKTSLPEYMVPNLFVPMSALPVTQHGKVDRAALPWPINGRVVEVPPVVLPVAPAPLATEPAPPDRIVKTLLALFGEALNVPDLTVSDDLFDVGATSFTMVRMVEQVDEHFGISVPIDVFLDQPTVAAIAEYLIAQRPDLLPDGAQRMVNGTARVEPESQEKAFALPEIRFTARSGVMRHFSGLLRREPFDRFLSLLKCHDGKYLYASAGGLNPTRTYVYIQAVEGIPQGVYYLHPLEHALYPICRPAAIDAAVFAERDRPLFAKADFAVFLIAQMDAIEPIYQDAAPTLVVLEAGYMGQLLFSRAVDFGLNVVPATGVDFANIRDLFDPGPEHQFIHCLLGGVADSHIGEQEQSRAGDFASSADLFAHCQQDGFAAFLTQVGGSAFPTPEVSERLHREQPQIRQFDENVVPITLANEPVDPQRYRIRACQRDYLEQPVPLASFSGFLSLLRPLGDQDTFLYPSLMCSLANTPGLNCYVYVRPDGVAGVPGGIYHYNPVRHELTTVRPGLSHELHHCYTPFNRKHAQQARFALFLVAPLAALRPLYGENSLYLALLESGYMGQLLLDRQAEFSIGVCPIGGMLFDKIRDDFRLAQDDTLVHSFVCGSYETQMPRHWQYLSPPPSAAQNGSVEMARDSRMYDIAITGISGRYPGAPDIKTFGRNLMEGRDSFRTLHFSDADHYHLEDDGGYSHHGGFLEDIDQFDSLFFGITPVEARHMDPQERLMLEVAQACLEDAGYTGEALNHGGRVGVYIGAMWDDYQHHGSACWQADDDEQASSSHASIANRISYFFDFKGPSVSFDTSCSSAMTALHHACVAINSGHIQAALVGGVNLMSHPYHQGLLQQLDMLSPDAHCHAFGRDADGWVAGEGVGAILIKARANAERDGDTIRALIRGTTIGHSGRTFRFGAPSAHAQEAAIRDALGHSGVTPDSINYVEAAAPGAAIADAAEFNALAAVFADSATRVGSVKPNIGHLESASAMSQLTKVLLQLKDHRIFPTIHVTTLNPMIKLVDGGLSIATSLQPWDSRCDDRGSPLPRRALINAFGATGSNGHAVLEEYVTAPLPEIRIPVLIVLSAETTEQLTSVARQLHDFLDTPPLPRLVDMGHTLRIGRVALTERLVLVAETHDELREKLERFISTGGGPDLYRGHANQGSTAAHTDASPEDLHGLAQQWVDGAAVSWDLLSRHGERRVPLPTYPFAGPRHRLAGRMPQLHALAPISRNKSAAAGALVPHLKTLIAQVSEIPISRLNERATFDTYGLTSAMITKLTALLEKDLGECSKTMFFEYQSIQDLADYLAANHADQLQRLGDPPAVTEPARPMRRPGTRPAPVSRTPSSGEPIAVIGLSGRYPGAPSPEVFWENLKNGVDSISEIPRERWDYRTLPDGAIARWGGFIDDVDCFDPLFFNISPREAERMDPQERLFLETVWHAVEDAGYSREALEAAFAGRVGVFTGAMYGEYQFFSAPLSESGFAISTSYGSIANRVSYIFNLHGPSLAIDSLCSSSLTALHLAVESIRRGECLAAIAGGVNLSLHPNKYLLLAEMQMASADGRCRSFGAGGTGMVPGEGVGAVLLKPLAQAERDGDRIYGMIRASAINHDGRTNGYTVPNPNAQAEMIESALARAGTCPEWISYVEAHGTGTPLGDPIEIAGLTRAFATDKTGYCALGSVKSNIGHPEAAAGIAGLTKILLQMQHCQLVPSLHAEETNPSIDFARTPFTLQRECCEWKRPTIDGREIPRLACISSFGAGGANAHAVIEEYRETASEPRGEQRPVVIVLSARDDERLHQVGENLLRFLEMEGRETGCGLNDLAFTLQVGREAMEERLAFIANDLDGVRESLTVFLNQTDSAGLFRDRINTRQDGIALLTDDEDSRDLIDKWIAKGRLDKIAELWVRGFAIDWPRPVGARRIALPLYPFARERYAPPAGAAMAPVPTNVSAGLLHPLLHRNTSDFSEQRYTSSFHGQAFFLADHVVVLHDREQQVLPAVAYLEMARAAITQASGMPTANELLSLQFHNIVWVQPLVVADRAQDVHISLALEEGAEADRLGPIHFEVYTDNGQRAVHSQGIATFADFEESTLDLTALQAEIDRPGPDCESFYRAFRDAGLHHGPAYRGLSQLHSSAKESVILARLELPAMVSETLTTPTDAGADRFLLHPSMMDAALQASAALYTDSDHHAPALPFALDELQIHGRCTQTMWAVVRPAAGVASDKIRKCDIDLCDEEGRVRVRMKGFSSRLLETNATAPTGTLLYQPVWRSAPIVDEPFSPAYATRELLVGNGLELDIAGTRLDTSRGEEGYVDIAAQTFETIKTLLARKRQGNMLLQILLPGPPSAFSGLIGLLRTAHLENPRFIGQLIEIDAATACSGNALNDILDACAALPDQDHIRYRDNGRELADWEEIEGPEGQPHLPWKDGGIYLITGGAGGLGRLLVREIANHCEHATVILSGRSARQETSDIPSGIRVEYRQTDITSREAVADLLGSIVRNHGNLHGIIHAAGVLDDDFIIRKSAEAFRAVLEPKVLGTSWLAREASDLDFLVLFSSTSGVFGNVAQADYAAANGFLDAVATAHPEIPFLSVNWPLWQEGGMRPDAATEQELAQSTGAMAMSEHDGFAALYRGLELENPRLLVLSGQRQRLRHTMDATAQEAETEAPPSAPVRPSVETTPAALTEQAHLYFKSLLCDTLRLPTHRIRAEEPLERYGIDSIMVMQMTNQLETVFGSLSKTLFFEYQTLAELTEYFLGQYGDRMRQLLGGKKELDSPIRRPAANGLRRHSAMKDMPPPQAAPPPQTTPPPQAKTVGIAVIGLTGRYPEAADLDTFWQNLAEGRNSISEVPAERWDWHDWFSQDATRTGVHLSRWGGFLDDVDKFDPLFFNIAPRDARFMDPQERLFLEGAWSAMEDAGYRRSDLPARTGVYAGVMYGEYQLLGLEASPNGRETATSNLYASIANRISYALNLHGPSMTIDTMCSSSLTCLDLALRDLQQGRTDLAFAGGVNLTIHPNKYTILSDSRFISNRGYCESFGEGGDGYIPGEGVGVAVLKRLDDALRDHDHIYGVIIGSAVNHDGKTNGYTVPNPRAQQMAIADALAESGVHAEDISYIEAHGTGTKLGDPIEMTGLTRAFSEHTSKTAYCRIGSAKSNIGHCESAAGIAGVTKVLLQMQKGLIAPSLHSEKLNPNIDFAATPFVVNQTLRPWDRPASGAPRMAGISSFGAGGSNAHLIIREHIDAAPRSTGTHHSHLHPIVLSALNEERLKVYAGQLLAWLEKHQNSATPTVPMARDRFENEVRTILAELLQVDVAEIETNASLEEYGIEPVHLNTLFERLRESFPHSVPETVPSVRSIAAICDLLLQQVPAETTPLLLTDLAYTLLVGREHLEERLGLIVTSAEELRRKLGAFLEGTETDLFRGNTKEKTTLFEADEALAGVVDTWLQRRQYDRLLKLWVSGHDLEWQKLWQDEDPSSHPHRISLPSYPFARQRYWLPDKKPNTGPDTITRPVAPQAEKHLAPQAEKTLAPRAETSLMSQSGKQWLCVAETWHDHSLPEDLDWQEALQHNDGKHIAIIYQDEAKATALQSLLEQLGQALPKGLHIDTVPVDALTNDKPCVESPDVVLFAGPQQAVELVAQPVEADLAAVFHLSQTLMQGAWNKPIRIYYLHSSGDGPRLDCEALSGFLKSAVMENSRHGWTCIDSDGDLVANQAQLMIQEWLADAAATPPPFVELRYRRGQRQLRRLEETYPQQPDAPVFRSGATYLLTGGFGPVGELLCRELAQRYRARLVILSRGALDEERRSLCRDLETLGASVHYHAVDIGDRDALQKTYAEVRREVGPIHGVIHLARLVEDGPILSKKWSSFQQVIRAKVQGTIYLDACTADEPLDFFLLFSSMGAFGIRGSADYGYSAAFQNAFAAWRRQMQERGGRPGETTALCWGFWSVDRYMPANREQTITESGFDPIDMAAAFPMIEAGCSHQNPALGLMAVRDGDRARRELGLTPSRAELLANQLPLWEQRQRQGIPLSIDDIHELIDAEEISTLDPELVTRLHRLLFPQTNDLDTPTEPLESVDPPQMSPPTAGPPTASLELTDTIRATLAEILEIDDIDENQPFPDYGLDSISGMRLTVSLEKKLAREIDAQWLIDFPTVKSLSQQLAKQQEPIMR